MGNGGPQQFNEEGMAAESIWKDLKGQIYLEVRTLSSGCNCKLGERDQDVNVPWINGRAAPQAQRDPFGNTRIGTVDQLGVGQGKVLIQRFAKRRFKGSKVQSQSGTETSIFRKFSKRRNVRGAKGG